MTGLNAIVLCLCGLVWTPTSTYPSYLNWWPALSARPLLQGLVHPYGLGVSLTLRHANFLTTVNGWTPDSGSFSSSTLGSTEKPRRLCPVVSTWRSFGPLLASTVHLPSLGSYARQFEIASSSRCIRPYNRPFSGPIAVFVSVFLIYPLGQSSLGSLLEFRCQGIFRLHSLPPELFIIGPSTLPYDGGQVSWESCFQPSMALQRTHCMKMVNKQTLLGVFHSTQEEEETYSMVQPATDFGHRSLVSL